MLEVVRRAPRPDAIAPDGSEIFLLLGPEQGTTRASMVEVVLPVGEVSTAVRHRTVEELWYFLEGRGQVWRRLPDGAEQVAEVEPGLALAMPTGCAFQFRNTGERPLRFLCVTCPPWPGAHEAEVVEPGGLDHLRRQGGSR